MNLPLSFNQRVVKDLRGILAFYEQQSGPSLADAFHEDLIHRLEQVASNPQQFPYSEFEIRRANLKRFPYHFLYRIKSTSVRILVIRHDRREPGFGSGRH